jgi:hypothetical protein
MAPKMSQGHDDISNKLLKTIYPSIKTPLLHILNISITKCYVPEEWKMAKVIPIFKKGKTEDCGNYRPISLLPTISKLIEKIVAKQVINYMETHKLITSEQFGFRAKHETSHAVLKSLDIMAEALNNNKFCVAIFADLRKAFDTVDHRILLDKLKYYGIDNRWFTSYLADRTQYVEFKGQNSNKATITVGVPQGSILGPLLFLIFINDLKFASNLKTILFADDTTLISIQDSEENAINITNTELNKAATWFNANLLTTHPEKTFIMGFNKDNNYLENRINMGNTTLTRLGENCKEKTIKFVGINLDEKLKWHHHIAHITKKVSLGAYIIAANKRIFPLETKKLLYNALIRPHLEYGITTWANANAKPLVKIQKRAIRNIAGTRNRAAHTNNLFIKLDILKFEELKQINIIKLMHKAAHGNLPDSLLVTFKTAPTGRTRNAEKRNLIINQYKQTKFNYSTLSRGPRIWNELPIEMQEITNVRTLGKRLHKKSIESYKKEPECKEKNCRSCL